jgi:hypothetical protein
MEILEIPIMTITPIVNGSKKELKFTCYQSIESGSLFTGLSTSSIEVVLKRSIQSSTVLTKKTANLIGGADTQVKVNNDSNFSIFLLDTDTEGLTNYTYIFIIKITLTDQSIYKMYVNVPII